MSMCVLPHRRLSRENRGVERSEMHQDQVHKDLIGDRSVYSVHPSSECDVSGFCRLSNWNPKVFVRPLSTGGMFEIRGFHDGPLHTWV